MSASHNHLIQIPYDILTTALESTLGHQSLNGTFLLDNASVALYLPLASKSLHLFFNKHPAQAAALEKLETLANHVALGEFEQAEKIWQIHPDLLTRYVTICHRNCTYSNNGQPPTDIPFGDNPGRYKYVNRTVWQIALMNEEYEEAERMGKFMTEKEKERQFVEIFPDGEIKKYGFDLEYAKQLLKNVIDAIANDDFINNDLTKINQTTCKTLQALYKYAKPNPNQEHQVGLVFDANFYLEALKRFYIDAYNKFGDKVNKYSFWSIHVEEWLAGCLGTGYLRTHSQGIGNEVHRRGCILADNSSYFAFRRPPSSLPSLHFFVGYYGQQSAVVVWAGTHLCRPAYQNLCQEKTRTRTDLMQRFAPLKISTCVIL